MCRKSFPADVRSAFLQMYADVCRNINIKQDKKGFSQMFAEISTKIIDYQRNNQRKSRAVHPSRYPELVSGSPGQHTPGNFLILEAYSMPQFLTFPFGRFREPVVFQGMPGQARHYIITLFAVRSSTSAVC